MKLPACLIALLLCTTPALADPVPSAADEAAIDKLIGPSLAALKANKGRQAAELFLGANPLTAAKTSDMAYLGSQIESTIGIYGPISDCQLTATRTNGALAEQRLYHCSHKHYLTRWIYLVVKTSDGWVPANFSFDDKIMNSLGE